ncbi:Regulator of V-ATPase in vacuolar membrane 1 [Lecanosticta acicola]|uniref:Regulator of V-ATPase in vacuolar membrane 1 n=1 Tax=Lecanosticta acicola TaxID=111012 RepID=A0AAI9E9M2_9PEZI|nr:Regulator of V-ATPase in vacuolar membrane 1 [Lecanosticta acicola]
MPSTSPGRNASSPPPSSFSQILPGAPTESLQSFATFVFRFKRYFAYISGSQLNILSSPQTLVQAIRFREDLIAIKAEEKEGKIVVADKTHAWVLEPHTEGWTKIWWERALVLRREDEEDKIRCLSWGNDGELLVGGDTALDLFSTFPSSRSHSPVMTATGGEATEERRALWSKSIPNPIRQAEFSPTATLIATCSRYDRLVKIWRRLSFEEGLFDYSYLPHSGTVTHVQWRPLNENSEERRGSGMGRRHEEDAEVLYTIANDGILRIWRTGGMHDADILLLHTTVDLVAAIPQSPSVLAKGQSSLPNASRYAMVLPSDQFCAAVNAAIGITQCDKLNHSKELLKEMVSKEPDVVVTFDGHGRMSAWGIQSIGHKRRPDTPTTAQPYHIAHAEALQLELPNGTPALCGTWFQDDKLHLLMHALSDGGELTWWQGDVETFFSSSTGGSERLSATATWCGHNTPIKSVQQSGDGLSSWSSDEVTQWRPTRSGLGELKARQSFGLESDVLAVLTLREGEFLLTVTPAAFTVWDQNGQRIAKAGCEVAMGGRFHVISSGEGNVSGVFVQSDAKTVVRWMVTLPSSEAFEAEGSLQLDKLSLTRVEGCEDVSFGLPVPMPFEPSQSCLVSIATSGRLDCRLLPDELAADHELEPFASFETGIEEPGMFTANEEFAAVVSRNRKELVIVDLTDGYVEHQQPTHAEILQLACFTPKARHNFIAVGYETTIDILAQGRYEHHSSDVPVWQPIRTVSISSLGLEVTALAWLSTGALAIAAGNAIFVTSSDVTYKEINDETKVAIDMGLDQNEAVHLSTVTHWLKDPLPAWHPSMLSHLLRHGHIGLAATLLKRLAQKLKFWSSGEELHPTLEEHPEALLRDLDQHEAWLDEDTVNDLREQLDEKDLPRTSQSEQQRLKHIIEALAYLKQHVNGLDRNALRYLFNWKLQLLFSEDKAQAQAKVPNGSAQPNGVHPGAQFVPDMHWREICFAYHSTTQQPLLDILVLHHDNKLTWSIARRLGIMAWLADREALAQVFEQLGQTAYRSEQPPDPVNASLYYLALHKKPTLLALWRIATWHREQRTTMNFLKRDFSQPDARTAAKKNAYALMGKRRFHYCAAFFLLADDPASATSVLAGQCEDPAFAIAVARLYCGDGSPVVRQLLEDRLVPQAKRDGNRWAMSWCHSVLMEGHDAAEVLVKPLGGVKTWQQDDPITLLLYQQLRKTPSEHEYDAVLRAARILRRMGLWLLALELVTRWEFKPMELATKSAHGAVTNGTANGVHEEPISMLDDFTAPQPQNSTASEAPSLLDSFTQPEPAKPAPGDEKAAREAKAAELLAKIKAKAKKEQQPAASETNGGQKREPTQFQEPDPNSLLDNFGF